jgi:TatD DNase family protein
MWIDTHVHLDAAEFDADRSAVLVRAREEGVTQMVIPAVERSNFERVRELAHAQGLGYALGIHPMYVDKADDADLDHLQAALAQHRNDPRLLAVGEIGLDYFVPGIDPERQMRFYVAQLALANRFDLPVILHVRRSADQLLKQLRTAGVIGGIAHAFNGSSQQAQGFIDLGFKLGFGGTLSFERSLQIRRLAQDLAPTALVLETDAPDIPPQWLYKTADQRAAGLSSRNEPAELPRIAAVLAGLRGWSLEETAAVTSANACAALPRLALLGP